LLVEKLDYFGCCCCRCRRCCYCYSDCYYFGKLLQWLLFLEL